MLDTFPFSSFQNNDLVAQNPSKVSNQVSFVLCVSSRTNRFICILLHCSYSYLIVLVYYGCSSIVAQTGCFKTIKMYSLTIESRVQNHYHWTEIRYQQGCAPSGGSRGASIPCLLQRWVAAGIPWLYHSNLWFCCHIAIVLCVCVKTLVSFL